MEWSGLDWIGLESVDWTGFRLDISACAVALKYLWFCVYASLALLVRSTPVTSWLLVASAVVLFIRLNPGDSGHLVERDR